MTPIVYYIDFDAILRAHQEHERRRAYTRMWSANRRKRGGMTQKAA